MSLSQLKEMMVLGVLAGHPSHGYALSELLEQGIGFAVGLTRPTLYGILRRLEGRGWLVRETERVGESAEREVYGLSDAGSEAYREVLTRCAMGEVPPLLPLAALLAHFDELSPEVRLKALTHLRRARAALLVHLEEFPEHGGCGGAAIALMHAQVRLEVEALDRLAAPLEGSDG